MKPGILPKLAGVPDLEKLERELREWMTRIEATVNEIREAVKPLDDRQQ